MRPKKSLGQNFLIQPNIVAKIIKASKLCEVEPRTVVLEVGPGRGILTRALLDAGARVIAVEKDDALYLELQQTFAKEISSGQLDLIHDDILEFLANPQRLDLIRQLAGELRSPYSVVANIPYNITGELLRVLLSGKVQPYAITILVQKEVAERIVAKDGKESILSISVKAYGTPTYIATVGRGNFYPAPNVDSAILNISDISKKFFEGRPLPQPLPEGEGGKREMQVDEKFFFKLLRAGFAHKRKLLARNLESVLPKDDIPGLFERAGVAKNARAEEVSLAQWGILSS